MVITRNNQANHLSHQDTANRKPRDQLILDGSRGFNLLAYVIEDYYKLILNEVGFDVIDHIAEGNNIKQNTAFIHNGYMAIMMCIHQT